MSTPPLAMVGALMSLGRLSVLSTWFLVAACSIQHDYTMEYTIRQPDGTLRKYMATGSTTDPDPNSIGRNIRSLTLGGGLPGSVMLIPPVDGVFVGISNFGERANRSPMPAHAIAAAFAYSLFLTAAKRTEKYYEVGRDELRFTLAADLHLDPVDASWDGADVSAVLRSLPGVQVRNYLRGTRLPSDHLWSYLGDGQSLTKARILSLAHDQSTRLSRITDPPLGIFYLATHGVIGPDGKSYAMAADSIEGDLKTWISYQEIADIFAKPPLYGRPLSAIIIFDTCLAGGDAPIASASTSAPEQSTSVPDQSTEEDDETEATDLIVPEGVEILSAAAPGQYSWHWREASDSVKLVDGKGPVPVVDPNYYYSLSILPPVAASTLIRYESDARQMCEENTNRTRATMLSAGFIKDMVDTLNNENLFRYSRTHDSARFQSSRILVAKNTERAIIEAATDDPKQLALFLFDCSILTNPALR